MNKPKRWELFFLLTSFTILIGFMGIKSLKVIVYMYGGLFCIYYALIMIRDFFKLKKQVGVMPYFSAFNEKLWKKKILYIYSLINIFSLNIAYKVIFELDLRLGKEWRCLILFFLWIVIYRGIINMSICTSMRHLSEKGNTTVVVDLLHTLFYFYPAYIINGIKSSGIVPESGLPRKVGVIYYIFERCCYDECVNLGTILSERFNRKRLETLMEIGFSCVMAGLCVPFFLLALLWNEHNLWGQAAKYLLILTAVIPMSIDMAVTAYVCQLYRWNQSWEERYRDILSQGIAAPNIQTLEFPDI